MPTIEELQARQDALLEEIGSPHARVRNGDTEVQAKPLTELASGLRLVNRQIAGLASPEGGRRVLGRGTRFAR